MKLSFQVNYKTVWGETLHAVLYRSHALANENKINIPLSTQDGQTWKGHILLEFNQAVTMSYHYEVRKDHSTLRREWQQVPRLLPLDPQVKEYILTDTWHDWPQDSWMYSSAMTRVFNKRPQPQEQTLPVFNRTLVLSTLAAPLGDQTVHVCGNCPELGNWNAAQAVPLVQTHPQAWSLALDAGKLPGRVEYKFLLKSPSNDQVIWEDGANRWIDISALADQQVLYVEGFAAHFKQPNPLRAGGVVIPVFSLRRENGWGIGDFGDLKPLTDWAQSTHQKVIQLLPVNDTTLTHTWQDSYPYNAVSVYALHPIYVNADALPPLQDEATVATFEEKRAALNALTQIDYEQALQLKLERLHQAFKANGQEVLSSAQFRQFFAANVHWLPAYAMFCALRDAYHTADFTTWPQHTAFSYDELVAFCAPSSDTYPFVCFWYYVQFVLHTQLLEAADYAREHGVILKGDIPIGISPHSVEAWTEPRLFHLNAQAGAPPDDFSATGQNWGFPTYNWDEMAKDGYRWWTRRLTHMATYFDAYRIDHILGFFRIWEIPMHSVQGLLGHFAPALPMDETEIAAFGLTFKPQFLQPLITEEYLTEKLGNLAQRAKEEFLDLNEDGTYRLREDFTTQRQVEGAFAVKNSEEDTRLKEGLYALISNVLFVQDAKESGKYHPRIAALKDGYFKTLSSADQQAFTALYNNYFYHRHNKFWEQEALKKLPQITQATPMLACAEDLGMIPACVKPVMEKLQLLSLEIQRMPKQPGTQFNDVRKYPYLSVATPSTHDMSVLRGWWKEDPKLTQKFYNKVLGRKGTAPAEADADICTQIIRMHMHSPSMLALIGLQDLTAMDETLRGQNPDEERINIPANPRHYWRYRMPMPLQTLADAIAFNQKITEMLDQSGR